MDATTQDPESRRQILKHLRKVLSGERLDAFRATHEESNLDLVGRYGWDVALSASFYPALRACEVLLRNSVHAALAGRFPQPPGSKPCFPASVDTSQPHSCSVSWLDRTSSLLLPENADAVRDAKQRVHRKCERRNREYTAGRLIAELNLNFWVALFSNPYGYQGASGLNLWPDLLRTVFPHAPASVTTNRREMAGRLNDIKELRNRVFHHEPIWRRDLVKEYEEIISVIGYISPPAALAVKRLGVFDKVRKTGMPRLLRTRIAPPDRG